MARSGTAPSPAQPIQIVRGGKTYNGSYTVAEKTVTVAYLGRTRTAPVGASAATKPETVASTLLSALVDAAGGKG